MAAPNLKHLDIEDVKTYFDTNVKHIIEEQNKHLGDGYKNGGWADWEANIQMLDEYYELLEASGGNKVLALDELRNRTKQAVNTTIDNNFYQYADTKWLQTHGLDGKYKNLLDYYRANYQEFRNQDASIFTTQSVPTEQSIPVENTNLPDANTNSADSTSTTAKSDNLEWWNPPEPYSDEFYQSHGLDPVQQRQAIKKMYESKGISLPEGLKKYFPDDPEVSSTTNPSETSPATKPEDSVANSPSSSGTKEVETNTPTANNTTETEIPKAQPKAEQKKANTDAPKTTPKTDASKKAGAATADKVADTVQAGKKMSSKTLGSGGKMAIAAVVAGLVIGKLSSDNKPKQSPQRAKNNSAARMSNSNYNNSNSYSSMNNDDAQIAAQISGYGYGKRIGGFM